MKRNKISARICRYAWPRIDSDNITNFSGLNNRGVVGKAPRAFPGVPEIEIPL
jgi:hypothetical protein